jgi:tetratricopeptide (TPR) repeat protein
MLIVAAVPLAATATRGESVAQAGAHHGWQELSLQDANEAQSLFAAVAADSPGRRDVRLGEALALLQLRSRTPGKIADAARILESLRAENPNDDVGIGAAYYLARIAQVHSFTPDRDAAVAGYRALLAAHPTHHYAQLAAPKLAMLLLYDDVPSIEWDRRVAEIEAFIPRLKAPEAIRDTRLTLAMALIRLRHDPVRAYPLFAACVNAGTLTRLTRINTVLLQAAECAQQLGHPAAAARYYTQFLGDFPQDAKSDEIRRRLAALPREDRQ